MAFRCRWFETVFEDILANYAENRTHPCPSSTSVHAIWIPPVWCQLLPCENQFCRLGTKLVIRQIQRQLAVGITACYAGRPVVKIELMRSPEGLSPNLSKEKRGLGGIEGVAVNTECKDIAFRNGGKTLVFHRHAIKAFPYQIGRRVGTRQSRL